MSLYQIQIDDAAVTKQINGIINKIFMREINNKYSATGHEISAAVKDIVYSHKDEIIEKVVDRATKEIVRKGLPKLLERGLLVLRKYNITTDEYNDICDKLESKLSFGSCGWCE